MATQDINYMNNIDLALNQIKNVVVEVVSTKPTTVTAGRIISMAGDLYIGKGNDYVKLVADGDVSALAERVTTLEGTVGDADSGLVKDVGDLQTAVGESTDSASASGSLYARIAQNVSDIETKVAKNADITAGTKCKITYDAKGLVTAGADLSASDIPDISATYVAQTQIVTSIAGTSDTNVPSEKAVSTAIASAVTGAYKVKGSKTVAQINALTSKVQGDVYNVSDAGTITDGPTVVAGDNVVWDGSAWDKLAGTIDLTGYVPKTTTVNGHALSSNVEVTASDVGLGNVDNTSDLNKPISTATQTALDGKVAKNDAITAGTATKITYDAKGLVTAGTTLAESDIPALSIGKTTGLQDALDKKLDDSQLVTAFQSTVADDKIPSEKLVKNSLDGKVDKVTGKSLVDDTEITKLAGVEAGAQANIIEGVTVNGTAVTPSSKVVALTIPALKTASVTTTAGTDTTVSGVGTGKTPRCVQVYNSAGEVVMCYVKVASGSLTVNTSSAQTLTVAWFE